MIPGDVSKPEDMEQAVVRTVAAFGALHLAVNNAGVAGDAFDPSEMPVDSWLQTMNVNLGWS